MSLSMTDTDDKNITMTTFFINEYSHSIRQKPSDNRHKIDTKVWKIWTLIQTLKYEV